MYYQAFPKKNNKRNYTLLYKRLPVSAAALLLFYIIICGYACQYKKTNTSMKEKEPNTQPADSARLLTVANAEATANGTMITAWFFETPQIFEFNLVNNEQAQQMFSLLKAAKEKGVPVNVYSTTAGGKNIITRIAAATEVQLVQYKKDKAMREQPAPVPPPGNK